MLLFRAASISHSRICTDPDLPYAWVSEIEVSFGKMGYGVGVGSHSVDTEFVRARGHDQVDPIGEGLVTDTRETEECCADVNGRKWGFIGRCDRTSDFQVERGSNQETDSRSKSVSDDLDVAYGFRLGGRALLLERSEQGAESSGAGLGGCRRRLEQVQ